MSASEMVAQRELREKRHIEQVGKRILEARKDSSITQGELAFKLGVSRGTLGDWERGDKKATPSFPELSDIARLTKTCPYYLMFGERTFGTSVSSVQGSPAPHSDELHIHLAAGASIFIRPAA